MEKKDISFVDDKATGTQVIDSINRQLKSVVSVLSRVTNIEQTIGNKQKLKEENTELKQRNARLLSSNDEKDEIIAKLKRQIAAKMRANTRHGNNDNDFIREEQEEQQQEQQQRQQQQQRHQQQHQMVINEQQQHQQQQQRPIRVNAESEIKEAGCKLEFVLKKLKEENRLDNINNDGTFSKNSLNFPFVKGKLEYNSALELVFFSATPQQKQKLKRNSVLSATEMELFMALLASQVMKKMNKLDADQLIVAYRIVEEDKKRAAEGKEPIDRT